MSTDASSRYAHRYRSRLEIVAIILGILSRGPAPKSRLVYGANLSSRQLESYLGYLLSTGLISNENPDGGPRQQQQFYSLTDKGLKALRVSKEIANLLRTPGEFDGDFLSATPDYRRPIPSRPHRDLEKRPRGALWA